MWYWLDGLINSDLISADFLAAVRVVGFLLGLLIAAAGMRRVSGRFAWIVMVFIGALCTKGLIVLFEHLGFYSWELMQASPWFMEFCAAFVVLVGGLGIYVFYKSKRRYRRYSR